MDVTDLGIATEVRPLYPEKAPCPILVTVFGITTDDTLLLVQYF